MRAVRERLARHFKEDCRQDACEPHAGCVRSDGRLQAGCVHSDACEPHAGCVRSDGSDFRNHS
jgi:hypothetical protein